MGVRVCGACGYYAYVIRGANRAHVRDELIPIRATVGVVWANIMFEYASLSWNIALKVEQVEEDVSGICLLLCILTRDVITNGVARHWVGKKPDQISRRTAHTSNSL